MTPPRPEPRSGLPAPYEDPWRRLAVDLQAAFASTGLRLRELWRRNGEGDLPRPALWPAAAAPLFWPLLLALILLVAAVLTVWLIPRQVAGRSGPADAPAPSLSSPPDEGMVAVSPGEGSGEGSDAASRLGPSAGVASDEADPSPRAWPIPLPGIPAPSAQDERSSLSAVAPRSAGAEGSPAPLQAPPGNAGPAPPSPGSAANGAGAAPDAAAASFEPDPAATPAPSLAALRAELVGDDPAPWILDLEAVPARSLLRLHLDLPFTSLAEGERRSLVERWWERCQALGYERLEVLDPGDRLLARPARVGSGMILLDSPSGRR